MTAAGCVLWAYGYFIANSLPFLNWPAFAPEWISDFLPTWEAELGLTLSTLGSVPMAFSHAKALSE
jgi:hypothetical protein